MTRIVLLKEIKLTYSDLASSNLKNDVTLFKEIIFLIIFIFSINRFILTNRIYQYNVNIFGKNYAQFYSLLILLQKHLIIFSGHISESHYYGDGLCESDNICRSTPTFFHHIFISKYQIFILRFQQGLHHLSPAYPTANYPWYIERQAA